MNTNKYYKAIIFDIDGTLLNTVEKNMHTLAQLMQETYATTYTSEDLMPYFSYTEEDALVALQVETHRIPELLRKWIDKIHTYERPTLLYEGILETLKHLKDANISLGIVSSKLRTLYQKEMIATGYDRYFESAILADDTIKHKPHPDPLAKCIQELQMEKEAVLYVGDSEFDAQCAKACGCDFAYAGWGPLPFQETYTHYLNKPQDLLDLIQTIERNEAY